VFCRHVTEDLSEWLIKRRKEKIPWNFRINSLQIRSDDNYKNNRPPPDDNNRGIAVNFYDHESNRADIPGVRIWLDKAGPKFFIPKCPASVLGLLNPLPASDVKVWTVDWNVRKFRMRVFCNGLKMVDFTLPDNLCGIHYNQKMSFPKAKIISYIELGALDSESHYFRRGDSKYKFYFDF
jgi:hypothetical protein